MDSHQQDIIDAATMKIDNPNIVGSGYIQHPPQRRFEKPGQFQPPTVSHFFYPDEYKENGVVVSQTNIDPRYFDLEESPEHYEGDSARRQSSSQPQPTLQQQQQSNKQYKPQVVGNQPLKQTTPYSNGVIKPTSQVDPRSYSRKVPVENGNYNHQAQLELKKKVMQQKQLQQQILNKIEQHQDTIEQLKLQVQQQIQTQQDSIDQLRDQLQQSQKQVEVLEALETQKSANEVPQNSFVSQPQRSIPQQNQLQQSLPYQSVPQQQPTMQQPQTYKQPQNVPQQTRPQSDGLQGYPQVKHYQNQQRPQQRLPAPVQQTQTALPNGTQSYYRTGPQNQNLSSQSVQQGGNIVRQQPQMQSQGQGLKPTPEKVGDQFQKINIADSNKELSDKNDGGVTKNITGGQISKSQAKRIRKKVRENGAK